MLIEKWETLNEIKERTGEAPETVLEQVKLLFRTNKIQLRFCGTRTEVKAKE